LILVYLNQSAPAPQLPTVAETDKPWFLTLILLLIFGLFTLFYSTFLFNLGKGDELRDFAQTAFNVIVGWCGIAIGYYLRGKVVQNA